jgi:hypothetical protein
MKTLLPAIAGALLLCGSQAPAVQPASTYTLFKATVSLTAVRLILGTMANDFIDKQESKTLATNDIINLALGNPLGTKVTTVLMLAVFPEGPGSVPTPKTKLVVYDPAPGAVTKILATVATVSTLDYEAANGAAGAKKGQGIGGVQIAETTLGDFANNKFFATALRGAGQGTSKPDANAGELGAFTFAGTGLAGPIHFKTTKPKVIDFDGIVTNAKISVSGKPVVLTF